MFDVFFSLIIVSQTPDPIAPPPDFQDPFASPPTEEPALPELPPPGETPAPTPQEQVAPDVPSAIPSPPPPPSLTPPPPPTEPMRATPFEFPQPSTEGPITEQILQNQELEAATGPGSWALGLGVGSAVNLNRHVTQMAFDLTAGYRLDANWEVGLLTYYRFVNVKYIGFLAQARYQFRLTDPDSFRTELAFMFATGWAIRSKSGGFNEGRLPTRLESEILMYATPKWALTARVGVESHLMGYANSSYTNFFKGRGLPSQLLLMAGSRIEF